MLSSSRELPAAASANSSPHASQVRVVGAVGGMAKHDKRDAGRAPSRIRHHRMFLLCSRSRGASRIAESNNLRVADPGALEQALAHALQFDELRQFKVSGEMMAKITAAHLAEQLRLALVCGHAAAPGGALHRPKHGSERCPGGAVRISAWTLVPCEVHPA